jgi:hypothetical protein
MTEETAMPISTQEAAEALSNIALAQQRASILRGYERGAPHFVLWGLIWVIGYSVSDVAPNLAGPDWLVLDAIGITGSYFLGRTHAANAAIARKDYSRRFAAAGATLFAFIFATYFIMKPHSAAQYGAFPALLMAAIYTVVGIWRGVRWTVSGVVLGIFTVAGFALLREHFMLWMAAAGGSALLVTGLWLRRA